MRRSAPLARTATLKRAAPLRRQSPAQARQGAAQRRVYREAGPGPGWCEACGKAGPVEHSHLYSQKLHPEHRNDPRNWQLLCRACHECFENNKKVFAYSYPLAWARAREQMRVVDPVAYVRFRQKNPF